MADAQEQVRNTKEAFRDAFGLFVGRGKRFAAEELSAATGISPKTIHAYLRGDSTPDWPYALALLNTLPVEFASAVLRPAGLSGMHRVDGHIHPSEALREILEGAAELAAALADGRIDHTEIPGVVKELTEAQCAIAQLIRQILNL